MTPRTEELFLICTGGAALMLLGLGFALRHFRVHRKGTS